MPRIGNDLKQGYYATPLSVVESISKMIDVQKNNRVTLLDPCVGEGFALERLISGLNSKEINSYGVELEPNRAEEAKMRIDHIVHAPFEEAVISNSAFSIVFNNPPYNDTWVKGMKLQMLFLKDTFRMLRAGGLMIWVARYGDFCKDENIEYLAKHYENYTFFKFDDEDFEQFKQCVFIGQKHSVTNREELIRNRYVLEKMINSWFDNPDSNQNVASIAAENELKYTVPDGKINKRITFDYRIGMPGEITENLEETSAAADLLNCFDRSVIQADQTDPKNQPKFMVKPGYVGLLMAAGAVSGEFGTGKDYHTVIGSENVSDTVKKEHTSSGVVTTTTTKREAIFTIATPAGMKRIKTDGPKTSDDASSEETSSTDE